MPENAHMNLPAVEPMQPAPAFRKAPPPLPASFRAQMPLAPLPLPMPMMPNPAPSEPAAAGPAQQFAVFSIAMALFVITAAIVFGLSGEHQAMPGGFAVVLLLMLLVGVVLGIFGVAWNNNPRHTGVTIAGIIGICLNAFFLLMICGAASAIHSRQMRHASNFGNSQVLFIPSAQTPAPHRPAPFAAPARPFPHVHGY